MVGGLKSSREGVEIGGTYKEENVFTQSGLVRNIYFDILSLSRKCDNRLPYTSPLSTVRLEKVNKWCQMFLLLIRLLRRIIFT